MGAALGSLATTGMSGCHWMREDALSRARRTQVLRVGYAIEAPFALIAPGGSVRGESPDVARHVIQALGISRIEWILTEFGELIRQLRSRRFDLIAAGLFITPERSLQVRFSEPTLHVQPGWLTAAGNPRQLGDYAQAMLRDGLRVVVIHGSVEHSTLQASASIATLIPVTDTQAGLAAVSNGQADGLALSLPTVRRLAATRPGRLSAVAAVAPGAAADPASRPRGAYTALAFHPDDSALQEACNQVLRRHIGSPEHLASLNEWGLGSADLPGGISTAEVLRR